MVDSIPQCPTDVEKGMRPPIRRLRHYYRLALIIWTVVLAALLASTLLIINSFTLSLATKEAQTNFDKDLAFRVWAAGHGGVYVPVTDKIQPSPYLGNISEQNIVTPSGRQLTLMNPAWMMRELYEQTASRYGVIGHLTSDRLMRDENAPDDWERLALHSFAAGSDEVIEEIDIAGRPYLRFMRPLFVLEECLKCHESQGYGVGDLRGGISISVPLDPYLNSAHRLRAITLTSYSGIWAVGLLGIIFGWRRFQIGRDVIERSAEEISTLNTCLEQRVRERTAELKSVNNELESFASSVSHDLQAPLRAISGFSQAVLQDYGPQLDEAGRHFLTRLDDNAGRMRQMISDLLKLSRSSRGEMQRDDVDLSAMAAEIIASLREEHPDRVVETVVQPAMHALGDQRLISALLDNLLRNAWKFTARTTEARIEVGLAETERGLAFFVRDNGAGFDMVYVNKIFAPFKRLHGADEYPGSGIGLAIVQRVAHRHGGDVWAESAVGQGAVFHFTLGGGSEPPGG